MAFIQIDPERFAEAFGSAICAKQAFYAEGRKGHCDETVRLLAEQRAAALAAKEEASDESEAAEA